MVGDVEHPVCPSLRLPFTHVLFGFVDRLYPRSCQSFIAYNCFLSCFFFGIGPRATDNGPVLRDVSIGGEEERKR